MNTIDDKTAHPYSSTHNPSSRLNFTTAIPNPFFRDPYNSSVDSTSAYTGNRQTGYFSEQQSPNFGAIYSNLNSAENLPPEEMASGSERQEIPSARIESTNVDPANVLQSVGNVLRRARMAKGLSIEEVSRQLRLTSQQIEAIEKEDFDKLPGRIFMRGFVRNYANFVHLDPAPLLQSLPGSAPVTMTHEQLPSGGSPVAFTAAKRQNSNNNRLVKVIFLFACALGAYAVYENTDWNGKFPQRATRNEVHINSDTASVEIDLPLTANPKNSIHFQQNKPLDIIPLPETKKPEPDTQIKTEVISIPLEHKIPVAVEKNATIAPATDDSGNLSFKLGADSWIKVVDGAGVALMEQIKKAGSELTLTGKKPLSIVLGNATGVNLTYNGNEVDLVPYKKNDGTARFTLR